MTVVATADVEVSHDIAELRDRDGTLTTIERGEVALDRATVLVIGRTIHERSANGSRQPRSRSSRASQPVGIGSLTVAT